MRTIDEVIQQYRQDKARKEREAREREGMAAVAFANWFERSHQIALGDDTLIEALELPHGEYQITLTFASQSRICVRPFDLDRGRITDNLPEWRPIYAGVMGPKYHGFQEAIEWIADQQEIEATNDAAWVVQPSVVELPY